MTPQAFVATLEQQQPPQDLNPILQALWWQGKDDWEKAHRIVQELEGKDSALVHAHLHRVEGDLNNAGYWYRQAGEPTSQLPLKEEWHSLVEKYLKDL